VTVGFKIFIGWDRRFPVAGRVLAYSLRKYSSIPLDIRFLDNLHLRECYGFERQFDPLATTEFTYSRFLVPWLCGYDGPALFMDNDMLCRGDVGQLLAYCCTRKTMPLRVVKHDHVPTATTKMYGCPQTSYPRKNWSSLMFMNCEYLKCWTKDVVQTASGKRLHRFEDLCDDEIGELPAQWNHLDTLRVDTGIIHWTSGMLWSDSSKTWPYQNIWLGEYQDWLASEGLPADTPFNPVVGEPVRVSDR
jgi:hypothetical protein